MKGVEAIRDLARQLRSGRTNEREQLVAQALDIIADEIEPSNMREERIRREASREAYQDAAKVICCFCLERFLNKSLDNAPPTGVNTSTP
jgi:hypothetical protein